VIGRARSRGLPTTPIAGALLTVLLTGVTPAHGGTLTVAWDPSPHPTVMGYRVYVGTASGAYTEIYDVGNVTTFSYNAAEGTTYYFAVAAYAPGPVVGPRSSEVSASAGSQGDPNSFWSSVWSSRATSSGLRTLDSPARRMLAGPRSSCSQPGSDGCLPAGTIGRATDPVTPFAASPEGRLFVIDGGRRVRVMTGRGVGRESLIIADRWTTLNQVTIDPGFATTGYLWVGETRTAGGRRTFSVARYRVVKSRAGERTEIISGLVLPPSGEALFAIGGSGHIYVAVPGSPGGLQPYWGTVLRFNPDGSVPDDHAARSPVIGSGYTFPHAIALEQFSDRVWLNGADQ
jgi:hypothetical protein